LRRQSRPSAGEESGLADAEDERGLMCVEAAFLDQALFEGLDPEEARGGIHTDFHDLLPGGIRRRGRQTGQSGRS
jgi:hypothetical protein